jgi:hypothetical protein
MAADAVNALVREWLATKHDTLFGRAFDLTQNVDAAAAWFTEQMDEFLRYAEDQPVVKPVVYGPATAEDPWGPKPRFDVV